MSMAVDSFAPSSAQEGAPHEPARGKPGQPFPLRRDRSADGPEPFPRLPIPPSGDQYPRGEPRGHRCSHLSAQPGQCEGLNSGNYSVRGRFNSVAATFFRSSPLVRHGGASMGIWGVASLFCRKAGWSKARRPSVPYQFTGSLRDPKERPSSDVQGGLSHVRISATGEIR